MKRDPPYQNYTIIWCSEYVVCSGNLGKVRSQPENRQVLRSPCPLPDEQSRFLRLSMAGGNSTAYSTLRSRNDYGERPSRLKGVKVQ